MTVMLYFTKKEKRKEKEIEDLLKESKTGSLVEIYLVILRF
jgi:hypothetical protein